MNKEDWGHPNRLWGLESYYDPGRAIEIYEAIKDLRIESILDIACGNGLVLESLSWMKEGRYEQFDIVDYPEWGQLRIKPFREELQCYIKERHPFDLIMFLNAYRNWDEEPKKQFNEWVRRNAKYFISSNPTDDGPSDDWKIIGRDCKNYELKLDTL